MRFGINDDTVSFLRMTEHGVVKIFMPRRCVGSGTPPSISTALPTTGMETPSGLMRIYAFLGKVTKVGVKASLTADV